MADFTQAVERAPASARDLADLTVAHLGAGDTPAYRRACVRMYERLSYASRPEDWQRLSRVCSLAANEAIEPERLVRLMDRAREFRPKEHAYLSTRGAVLYRAGRYEVAVHQLRDAVAVHGRGGSFEDWVFLAMAEFRLGHADQARQDLRQAVRRYDERLQPSEPGGKAPDWSTRVEWKQLRKEAEGLLQAGKP